MRWHPALILLLMGIAGGVGYQLGYTNGTETQKTITIKLDGKVNDLLSKMRSYVRVTE